MGSVPFKQADMLILNHARKLFFFRACFFEEVSFFYKSTAVVPTFLLSIFFIPVRRRTIQNGLPIEDWQVKEDRTVVPPRDREHRCFPAPLAFHDLLLSIFLESSHITLLAPTFHQLLFADLIRIEKTFPVPGFYLRAHPPQTKKPRGWIIVGPP